MHRKCLGRLAGRPINLTTAKYLPREQRNNLDAANALARLWEREGKAVRPGRAPMPAAEEDDDQPAGIQMAVEGIHQPLTGHYVLAVI